MGRVERPTITARFALRGQPCESSGRPLRRIGYRGEQVKRMLKEAARRGDDVPSYSQICSALDMERGNLHYVVRSLEIRGILVREGSGQQKRLRLIITG